MVVDRLASVVVLAGWAIVDRLASVVVLARWAIGIDQLIGIDQWMSIDWHRFVVLAGWVDGIDQWLSIDWHRFVVLAGWAIGIDQWMSIASRSIGIGELCWQVVRMASMSGCRSPARPSAIGGGSHYTDIIVGIIRHPKQPSMIIRQPIDENIDYQSQADQYHRPFIRQPIDIIGRTFASPTSIRCIHQINKFNKTRTWEKNIHMPVTLAFPCSAIPGARRTSYPWESTSSGQSGCSFHTCIQSINHGEYMCMIHFFFTLKSHIKNHKKKKKKKKKKKNVLGPPPPPGGNAPRPGAVGDVVEGPRIVIVREPVHTNVPDHQSSFNHHYKFG
jgi:hypothetical protein